jgi:hypothetical protein
MKTISEGLREFNAWRRGAETEQPNSTEIGLLIDTAADRLEVLERESARNFERWHAERVRREAMVVDVDRCYRMLLSEPNTNGALFKAENILRNAIADARGADS